VLSTTKGSSRVRPKIEHTCRSIASVSINTQISLYIFWRLNVNEHNPMGIFNIYQRDKIEISKLRTSSLGPSSGFIACRTFLNIVSLSHTTRSILKCLALCGPLYICVTGNSSFTPSSYHSLSVPYASPPYWPTPPIVLCQQTAAKIHDK
jgi:hypothetical protein